MSREAPHLRPRALAPGSRVALVAPAGPLDGERIEGARRFCRSLGLEPRVYPSAGRRHRFLAGPDEARLRDLQDAFDDRENDAVWSLRGGYGTQRIVDALDPTRLREDPVAFLGFSDNTALHLRLARLGVVSLHAPHPDPDLPEVTREWLRRLLFRAEPAGAVPIRPEDPSPRTLVPGVAEGPLVGGNLALLAAACGTRDQPRTRGAVLFLEEVGEPAYRVDRMLLQLRRSGALEGVAGLALGRFTPREGTGGEAAGGDHPVGEVLEEHAEATGVPAVVDLPFGHVLHNCALPLGVAARLDASGGTLEIVEPAVRRS